MLDDLATVDWSALTHAYGAADDVPDLLRDLAGGSGKALSELYGNIWHQGTVYEATAYAVPFLIRVLEAPGADPGGVLGLLASIADGTSYMDVHRGLLPRSQRDSGEIVEQMDAELGWVAAAGRAVAEGMPVYLRLLATHPDEDVRAATAHLLGGVGAGAARQAGLRQAAGGDPSDLVRACAVLALAAVDEPVAGSLSDPEPLPRLAAAIVTANIRADDDPEPVPEPIAQIIERDAPDCLTRIQRLPGGVSNGLSWVIAAVARHPRLQIRLLTAWLRHPGRPIREAAAYAVTGPLHTWRPAAAALVPALAAAQRDSSEAVRTITLRHLAGAGQAAAGAADLLWAAVEKGPVHSQGTVFADDRPVGASALVSLCLLRDPRADRFLAALLRERPLRTAGLDDAIEAIGPWATACRSVIVDAVEAAEAGAVRARLIRAAGRAGADPAGLVPVLRRHVAEHPHSASELLGDLGPAAVAALPELIAMRADDDPARKRIAARALWRITGEVDDLLTVLRDQIREHGALETLAEVGPAAAGLAELLPPMFDGDDEWRAVHAAIAYWHLTGAAGPVVPVLVRYVACVPWGVLAVRALAAIGPAAQEAIPVLRAHAGSPYRAVGWRWGGSDGLVAEDEGWLAVCHYAIDRIQGGQPDSGWPDVLVPEAFRQP
ncbi:HEAT repeat domain-containing protein [Actinoplanes aureus]|uniref:HEAT repeat domain-containing protein n=1 Tax=Actinoplanes aureus TaxID=2792083 RepID=A0A931G206_9ACTN|nr:HEAT repeat domain-containing protein [Actinoplanes aureus]MBG0567615.1 hypothetical protein [Actinoplanes aureus]